MNEEQVLAEFPDDPRLTGFAEGYSSSVRSRPLIPQGSDALPVLESLARENLRRVRAEKVVSVLMNRLGESVLQLSERDLLVASRSAVIIAVSEGAYPIVHVHYTREEAGIGQRQGRQEGVRVQEPSERLQGAAAAGEEQVNSGEDSQRGTEPQRSQQDGPQGSPDPKA